MTPASEARPRRGDGLAQLILQQPALVQARQVLRDPELVELELGGHEPTHAPVIEEQVDVVVLAVYGDPFLAPDKRVVAAQLNDDAFHLAQDGGFQVLLAAGALEPEEIAFQIVFKKWGQVNFRLSEYKFFSSGNTSAKRARDIEPLVPNMSYQKTRAKPESRRRASRIW
jgi:hypothetical protein